MAARSVFKLFFKTYSCTVNSQATTTTPPVTKEPTVKRQLRSISSSPHRSYKKPKQEFWQIRNLSKSLENLRENRYRDEEYEPTYDTDRNVFPSPKDATVRDLAKEFKPPQPEEEINEEGNPIYELGECTKSQETFYDVFNFMRTMEQNKQKFSFIHLQPNNLKPYGSFENIAQVNRRKAVKIVYPANYGTIRSDTIKKKNIETAQQKEFSSSTSQMNDPASNNLGASVVESRTQDQGKIKYSTASVVESRTQDQSKIKYSTTSIVEPRTKDQSKINYSTTSSKKKSNENLKPVRYVRTSISRMSSTALLKNKKSTTSNNKQYHGGVIKERVKKINQTGNTQIKTLTGLNLSKIIKLSKEIFLHQVRTNAEDSNNCQPVEKEVEPVCEKYVKIKLGECEDECGKPKKCKQIKKICFGRLPKLTPADCPCIEDLPLKEGNPIPRIKKRFNIPDRDNTCPPHPCIAQPRADKNYKIVKKQLPVITPSQCFPCEQREMTDLVIRRLPKMKAPDPPKRCPCLPDCNPCPPRADDGYAVKRKPLPKFGNNNCPCVEDPPMKSVPLKRLVAKPVIEPPKICPVPCTDMNPTRADFNLKIEKKILPTVKAECACVNPPPMEEGTPFKRLKKVTVKEPPKVCPPPPCPSVERADKNLKVKPKRLPVFRSEDCPCVDPELPVDVPKLKRLIPKYTPKEKEKICPPPPCPPRADDGLKVVRKQLPVIEVQDCPCVETEIFDCPPLKKLIPRPVVEPKCVIIEECEDVIRADDNLTVEKKVLPRLPAGDCPCVDPLIPLDVKPLKKLVPRPVYPKPPCIILTCADTKRADDGLKVESKKLPRLEVPDCPCVDPIPPEDSKPLKRLRKKHVPEPERICPRDPCEEIPRADEDDWMYWKCVEVKPCESPEDSKDIKKSTETKAVPNQRSRAFSTLSRRNYSTNSTLKSDLFNASYSASSVIPSSFKQQSHDVIIDIQPSAPLILTQKPLKVSEKSLQRCSSEPVDCIAFVIYKSNGLRKNKRLQEGSSEMSLLFHNRNRFISTCSALYENVEGTKSKVNCECPPNDRHLQPKWPIIKEKEQFIKVFPSDKVIAEGVRKSQMYAKGVPQQQPKQEDEQRDEVLDECEEEQVESIVPDCDDTLKQIRKKEEKPLSLWERIVNFFKARPDCPPPEEFKKMRLKEEAERAARKAGLCVYDPKEMLRKNEKELPKVITPDSVKEECSK